MELCFFWEKWEAQWPERQSWVPQPSPTPLLSASEPQREDTAAPLTEQPAAIDTGQSADSQLSTSSLPCKTNSETTRKGYTGAGKLPSSYIPKRKCCSLDLCSYDAVHLPHSNFLFCPLISALFVTHLTPIWECFKSDCLSGSITWYFPGCWFWAQAGVFVVTPSHLNTALANALQVQEGLHTHDSYSLLWKSWTSFVSLSGYSISLWSGRILLRDSALGWQICKLLWDLFLCKFTDMTHYTNIVMCENSRGKYNPKPPS